MASERQDGGRPGRILAIAARSRRRLTSNPAPEGFITTTFLIDFVSNGFGTRRTIKYSSPGVITQSESGARRRQLLPAPLGANACGRAILSLDWRLTQAALLQPFHNRVRYRIYSVIKLRKVGQPGRLATI